MRILAQRVKKAKVTVSDKVTGEIGPGLLLFLASHKDDTPDKTVWLTKKIIEMRIFPDENDKMNRNVIETGGAILVVSQFTLYGTLSNGRRPDFGRAALPEPAFLFYEKFIQELSDALGQPIQTGIFGAYMEVSLVNDGPATFLLER